MSEQLPHNEQWDDLPVPDGEASWQKMKLLLEEEDRRRVLPLWFWRYAALGLLLIGMVVGGWWMLCSKNNSKEIAKTKQENVQQQSKNVETVINKTTEEKLVTHQTTSEVKDKTIVEKENGSKQQEAFIQNKVSRLQQVKVKKEVIFSANKRTSKNEKLTVIKQEQNKLLLTDNNKSHPLLTTNNNSYQKPVDSLKQAATQVIKDTIAAKDSVVVIAAEPIVSTEGNVKKKNNKSRFVWSAGIGLQQSIAFNGQQSSSYNYRGNQSSVGDHIPSIYLRLQRGKWFMQAEANYAVPQPVRLFSFSQVSKYDAASFTTSTEKYFIQKVYYHQLSLSSNYFIVPNWSVGAGGMYNILAGAVTQQEINSRNVVTGVESITKNISPVKGYKDSFLYKTTAGILLQTDYHWKRFSLGLRFTQNLQPFIKYTKPTGEIMDEKNNALQAVLRFRLWKSN